MADLQGFNANDVDPRVSFEAIEKILGDLDGKRNMRVVRVEKGSKTESVPVMNQ